MVLMFYIIQELKKHNHHGLNVLYYTSTQEAQPSWSECFILYKYTRSTTIMVLMFYIIQELKKHYIVYTQS